MSVLVGSPRLRHLFDLVGGLVAESDPDEVFDEILGAARELTGAGYAALGVLNKQRDGLERFHTAGVDEEIHRAIGHVPRGRGVLGMLILDPKALRLDDVASHPSAYGFPEHHPVIHSFLSVPVSIRDVVWGSLYLAEKRGGPFNEGDEEIAAVLAGYAATAIETARSQQPGQGRGASF
jgi:GAF domain-containing protein